MQPKMNTSANSFSRAIKGRFLSPLFILFLVSVFAFLSLCLFSFFFECKNILIPFTAFSDIMSLLAPWGTLALVNVYAGLVVAAFALLGFLMVLVNMFTDRFGSHCKLGFYLIKIPMFFQNILTLLSVTLVSIKLIRDLVFMLDGTEQWVYIGSVISNDVTKMDLNTFVVWGIISVVVVAVFLLLFSFKSLMTISVMKEAVCTETPITNQYLFSAVGCFLFSAVGVASPLKWGFNLTLTFSCVSIALFGVFCILFRSTMRCLEIQE